MKESNNTLHEVIPYKLDSIRKADIGTEKIKSTTRDPASPKKHSKPFDFCPDSGLVIIALRSPDTRQDIVNHLEDTLDKNSLNIVRPDNLDAMEKTTKQLAKGLVGQRTLLDLTKLPEGQCTSLYSVTAFKQFLVNYTGMLDTSDNLFVILTHCDKVKPLGSVVLEQALNLRALPKAAIFLPNLLWLIDRDRLGIITAQSLRSKHAELKTVQLIKREINNELNS